MRFDNELFMIANYEASKGLIPVFSTDEEVRLHRAKVARIFNRYKTSIQNGECDITFILNTVMTRYGSIPQPKITAEEMVENLIEGKDMCRVEENPLENDLLNIAELRKKLSESLDEEDEGDDEYLSEVDQDGN